ncbi:MAG TPA: prepilin peptidase [Candidatus Paceibacterota bacterium]
MSLYIFIFGLVVGSFVNVIIFRVPKGRPFINGRSMCPKCGNKLAWFDMIPVLSFLFLRGQCRYCRKGISWTYPLVEIFSGLIFLIVCTSITSNVFLQIFLIFVVECALVLAAIDYKHLILPDSIIIFWVGGAAIMSAYFFNKFDKWWLFNKDHLWGTILLFCLMMAVWLLSKGKGLGFGDVKLAAATGFIFGFWDGLKILYLGIVFGAVWAIFLLISRRATLKTKLPLGFFVCLSVIFYLLGGDSLLLKLNYIFYSVPHIFK